MGQSQIRFGMSELSATAKRKLRQSRRSSTKRKPRLEFSKKLTIGDSIGYVVIMLVVFAILLFRPELATFAQNFFAYLTTAYVSLRLGYTAKAGVENYKKIAENYKTIAELASEGDPEMETDCESDDEESLG